MDQKKKKKTQGNVPVQESPRNYRELPCCRTGLCDFTSRFFHWSDISGYTELHVKLHKELSAGVCSSPNVKGISAINSLLGVVEGS